MAGEDDGDPYTRGVESLVLGVVSWWTGKFHRNEVLNLVTRHFQAQEVYEAGLKLARASNLGAPVRHNNTPSRSACEANAIDLVNTLLELDNQKQMPKIMIPSDQLEHVPLDALAVSAERSVSARLESLENCMKEVTKTMQVLVKNKASEHVILPPMPVPSAPLTSQVPSFSNLTVAQQDYTPLQQGQTYAEAVSSQVVPGQAPQAQVGNPHLLVPPKVVRERSRSPAQKRKHGEGAGDVGHAQGEGPGKDGFRKQGRPRKTEKGASKVKVDGVGDYQPSLQYYIGNTPGKASKDVIKKVLQKCSEPLLAGGEPLEVEELELLTQVDNPRTKCWRIVVPYKFMSLMENPELYPEGWRHRRFFGTRKVQEKSKQPRLDNNVVDDIMKEVEQERLLVIERQEQDLARVEHAVATTPGDVMPDP